MIEITKSLQLPAFIKKLHSFRYSSGNSGTRFSLRTADRVKALQSAARTWLNRIARNWEEKGSGDGEGEEKQTSGG